MNINIVLFTGYFNKKLSAVPFEHKAENRSKEKAVFFTHARAGILPAVFLNAGEWASYDPSSSEPNDVQLVRFSLLDEADIRFINHRRGRENRLAVALLIG